MIILDIALMVLVASTIVGLLTWSIFTQHRHHGCEDVRIHRHATSGVKRAPRQEPELAPRPEPELLPHTAIAS